MTDNRKFRDIIENQDVEVLLALDSGEKEDFLFVLIYDYLTDKPLDEMNEVKKLCFSLQNLKMSVKPTRFRRCPRTRRFFLLYRK